MVGGGSFEPAVFEACKCPIVADGGKGGVQGAQKRAVALADRHGDALVRDRLVARTARGRCLNDGGWRHLGMSPPVGQQVGLFDAADDDATE